MLKRIDKLQGSPFYTPSIFTYNKTVDGLTWNEYLKKTIAQLECGVRLYNDDYPDIYDKWPDTKIRFEKIKDSEYYEMKDSATQEQNDLIKNLCKQLEDEQSWDLHNWQEAWLSLVRERTPSINEAQERMQQEGYKDPQNIPSHIIFRELGD
jgi:hypothetical protein